MDPKGKASKPDLELPGEEHPRKRLKTCVSNEVTHKCPNWTEPVEDREWRSHDPRVAKSKKKIKL